LDYKNGKKYLEVTDFDSFFIGNFYNACRSAQDFPTVVPYRHGVDNCKPELARKTSEVN
jgi:hypothetical protein